MTKTKLLCVDFEFHEEIYNKIWERHKNFDITIINRADMALKLMLQHKFDFLITTIVMPSKLDGLSFIDKIKKSPKKYGEPTIAVVTGLGGDKYHEEILKRQVDLIDRYERQLAEIEKDIDLFLRFPFREVDNPYPTEDVQASIQDESVQRKITRDFAISQAYEV